MLTDTNCRNASCPADKPRARFADSGGLYLEVSPAGSKRWFVKFRINGKEKRLSLGSYPAVTLKAARDGREAARKVKAQGVDPVQSRQAERLAKAASSATTYEVAAREFHAVKSPGWSEGHASKWLRMNELYLFPHIGTLPLDAIKPPALIAVLRKVERKGILSTAQDLQQMAGQVFRYGVQSGLCEHNPASDLKGVLKPHIARHFSAVLDPIQVGALLRAIDAYQGQPATAAALKLSALFFQRPGNIRAMEWAWVDIDDAMLTIPATEMKRTKEAKVNGKPHLVPLASQAIEVLKSLAPLTGSGKFVFPGARSNQRPLSDGTINAALRRMDFGKDEHVAHGFRAMARTMMAERLPGIAAELVEAQLGHGKAGPLGSAYDRAEYLEQRRQMMQAWADYLDRLREGAQVLEFKGRAA